MRKIHFHTISPNIPRIPIINLCFFLQGNQLDSNLELSALFLAMASTLMKNRRIGRSRLGASVQRSLSVKTSSEHQPSTLFAERETINRSRASLTDTL